MNPHVQNHLDLLTDTVEELTRIIESAHAKIDALTAEKERITLDNLGKKRRIAILEDNVSRLNEVSEENRRLRDKQAEATEHAARLLAHVRELQGKFTP